VYYKVKAMFYNYPTKKALKNPPQILYWINPLSHLLCFVAEQGWFCPVSGRSHSGSQPTTTTPSLPTLSPTPPQPWASTTTTA